MDSPETNETLAPTYVPLQGRHPLMLAPVLALEGLDPWAEIRGPALLLDEARANGEAEAPLRFDDPAQLVLEPPGAAPAAVEVTTLEDDPHAADELPSASADLPVGDAASARADPAGAEEALRFADLEAVPSGQAPRPEADVAPAAELDVATPFESATAAGGAEAEPAAAAEPTAVPAPDPIQILYGDARNAAEDGRRDEAQRLYRELLGRRPAHVGARNNLALLLDADGNHEGALAELDRALEYEPDNSTLLVNRGALLGATGRFAAAERDLKKVLRLEPAHAEALFNLGVVLTKKGLWGEAVPHLRRAVELDPDRGAAHYYLGEALNHVDDLYGALAAYQRAAELQPTNPRALYGLGIIYDRLGRPDDAAQMYRRSREVGRR
jgi:Flp pilus assembly protein TadD